MNTPVDTGAGPPYRTSGSRALRWAATLALVVAIAAVTLWVHLFEFNGTNTWDSALFLSMG